MTKFPGLQSFFYGWNQRKFVNQTDLVFKEMIQLSVMGVCQYQDEMKKSRQKHTIAEIHSEMTWMKRNNVT